MLQTLYIKNYALIEETRVELNNGLVTITGETGAGKSILLGALGLIVGNRADTGVLRDKESKCIVEAVFDVEKLNLQNFFSDNELEYDHLTIVRREILPGGKTRAFVNDSPVQLTVLKSLGDQLIDIHSQHETLLLRDEGFQTDTLDLMAQNQALVGEYQSKLKQLRKNESELKELKEKEQRIKQEHEFTAFQFNEISEANLVSTEQEELETELGRGEHSEEIKIATSAAIDEISESETNLLGRIYTIRNLFHKMASYDKEIESVSNRLQEVYNELKDILTSVENISENTEFDPARKQMIEDRLDLLYTLQKKHRVDSVPALLELMDQMESNLVIGANFDEHITQLENGIQTIKTELYNIASSIHKQRVEAAIPFEKDILQVLKVLGMPESQFVVNIEPTNDLGKTGTDKIKYLFSANKGMQPEDVTKVASGGEISRFMLAIKALVSSKKNQPTIVFDEIDTGVSGNIADKLGQVMQKMSKNQQVISITHLPQIASKGDLHLKVEKHEVNKKTVSTLTALNENQRIQELAVMLSGEAITDEAIKNAKVLLGVS